MSTSTLFAVTVVPWVYDKETGHYIPSVFVRIENVIRRITQEHDYFLDIELDYPTLEDQFEFHHKGSQMPTRVFFSAHGDPMAQSFEGIFRNKIDNGTISEQFFINKNQLFDFVIAFSCYGYSVLQHEKWKDRFKDFVCFDGPIDFTARKHRGQIIVDGSWRRLFSEFILNMNSCSNGAEVKANLVKFLTTVSDKLFANGYDNTSTIFGVLAKQIKCKNDIKPSFV